ncbi:hypothetical protein ABZ172_25875 [Streptomyces sp. NPDC006296]|uniref:hypothetical protein n=1 Tax=Streptomyces sp. NPDC006296 TaxID=3156746 RepID=UPI0033BC5918
MSTEQTDSDMTGPRRRRSPFAAASVAAAVLLTGGGAAYWAAAASGDTGADAGRAVLGDGGPPPLALDLADSASAPPPGIAPGEPDPRGGGVVYRASGALPDGPDSAAVQRARGTVTAAEAARLAKALGVPGTPHTDGTAWRVGSDGDGSGPVLKVTKQAPGTWTFARYGPGGSDACAAGPECAKQDRTPPSGSPVDARTAKAAAVPVLKAVGQDGAALDTDQLMGSVRVVNADPVVDGLPTYGWSTGIQVGAGGEIVGGSGHLKGLTKGDTYPVTGAQEALDRLNAESRPRAGSGTGGCATPVPLEGDTDAPAADDCGTAGGTPPAATATVEKAVFGLAAQYADGEKILVPAWIFSLESAGDGPRNTVVRVAVDPDHLAPGTPSAAPPQDPGTAPAPTDDPDGTALTAYSADGRTLEVTFWGGACSTYTARAAEDGTTVRVTVTASEQEPGKACIMMAKELTRTVTLDAPLDGRKVLDAASGGTVPRA